MHRRTSLSQVQTERPHGQELLKPRKELTEGPQTAPFIKKPLETVDLRKRPRFIIETNEKVLCVQHQIECNVH